MNCVNNVSLYMFIVTLAVNYLFAHVLHFSVLEKAVLIFSNVIEEKLCCSMSILIKYFLILFIFECLFKEYQSTYYRWESSSSLINSIPHCVSFYITYLTIIFTIFINTNTAQSKFRQLHERGAYYFRNLVLSSFE